MNPNQAARQKELRKQSQQQIGNYVCDCGQKAVRIKCSARVYQRCLDLEERFYGTNIAGKQLSTRLHGAHAQ